jgi:hypothetical protein
MLSALPDENGPVCRVVPSLAGPGFKSIFAMS